MKERPILFSGEMVRAILEGRKTMTRRVIKPPPCQLDNGKWYWQKRASNDMVYVDFDNGHDWWEYAVVGGDCPYGQPGDRLWVRETWAHDCPHCRDPRCGNPGHIWYRATEHPIVADSFAGDAHWRPSIHMPRWASRITLEIISVRVERVQDISEEDAEAEGVFSHIAEHSLGKVYRDARADAATAYFRELWDSINAKRGYSWDSNPWVWVVEFKRLDTDADLADHWPSLSDRPDGVDIFEGKYPVSGKPEA